MRCCQNKWSSILGLYRLFVCVLPALATNLILGEMKTDEANNKNPQKTHINIRIVSCVVHTQTAI